MGIDAKGELRIPEEKRVIEVALDDDSERELELVERSILQLIYSEKPPLAKKIPYCRKCAYRELCWA